MVADTNLVLAGIGIPRFSARGIKETLAPLELGELRRNINGTLVDLTDPALHRKYGLTISGDDVRPAALDKVWMGKVVTVSCVSTLGQAATFTAGAASIGLGRGAVAGSGLAQVDDLFSDDVEFAEDSGGETIATAAFADTAVAGAGFIFYRPVLVMMVRRFSGDFDEWKAGNVWSLDLEEV